MPERLPPTLPLLQAAGRDWDAVVVGAGPAGSLAALHLARLGVSTLLVERADLPRGKVCGCCLNPRVRGVLERAGLGALPDACEAVPLTGVLLAAGGASARLPLSGGVALSRESFDTALARAAVQVGAHFLPRTRATLAAPGDDADERCSDGLPSFHSLWLHQAAGPVEVHARVVLAADGLGGQLLARAGLTDAPPEPGTRIGAGVTVTGPVPSFYSPGTIYMACSAVGYVGLVRLEDGRLDLAAAFDACTVKVAGGPGALAVGVLGEVGWPVPARLAELPWKGTLPLTRRARRLAPRRVFVLGDAAGYVEPFTGEGMAWALASAEALAPLAARAARRWHPALAAEWARRHARLVTRRQWACRATAALLRRPRLMRGVVALLSRLPVLARPVIDFLSAPPPCFSQSPQDEVQRIR